MPRGLSDRGVALAVVSSTTCDNVRHVLGADRAALIDYDACGASLFGKRGPLRRVLKESGVRPGEAIVIGDEIRDIEGALAARSTASLAAIDTRRGQAVIVNPDGARANTKAIAKRVRAWPPSRVGRKPRSGTPQATTAPCGGAVLILDIAREFHPDLRCSDDLCGAFVRSACLGGEGCTPSATRKGLLRLNKDSPRGHRSFHHQTFPLGLITRWRLQGCRIAA